MNEPNYRSALSRAGFGISQHSNDPGQWYVTCAPLGQLQPFGSVEEAVMYGVQLLISTLLDYQQAAFQRDDIPSPTKSLAPFRVVPHHQGPCHQQPGTSFVVPHAQAYLRQHIQTGAWVVVTERHWLGPFANGAAAANAALLRGLVIDPE